VGRSRVRHQHLMQSDGYECYKSHCPIASDPVIIVYFAFVGAIAPGRFGADVVCWSTFQLPLVEIDNVTAEIGVMRSRILMIPNAGTGGPKHESYRGARLGSWLPQEGGLCELLIAQELSATTLKLWRGPELGRQPLEQPTSCKAVSGKR
jgi:hypothetical protein